MGRGRRFDDLTGEKYGSLTVKRRDGSNPLNQRVWICQCVCGKEVSKPTSKLKPRKTDSCVCDIKKWQVGCFERLLSDRVCDCGTHFRAGGKAKRCRECWRINRTIVMTGVRCTIEEYKALMAKAGGFCEACGIKAERPCLDHDHVTGKPRGILCNSCNTAEGNFKNDYTRLLRLYEYCIRHERIT